MGRSRVASRPGTTVGQVERTLTPVQERLLRRLRREGEPLIFSAGRYGTHAFLD